METALHVRMFEEAVVPKVRKLKLIKKIWVFQISPKDLWNVMATVLEINHY